jgi:hypothetical protein
MGCLVGQRGDAHGKCAGSSEPASSDHALRCPRGEGSAGRLLVSTPASSLNFPHEAWVSLQTQPVLTCQSQPLEMPLGPHLAPAAPTAPGLILDVHVAQNHYPLPSP